MKKVCVLMSTYNGEKYIEEQIESILNQKDLEVNLIVRDDGSNDNTISILEKYASKQKLTFYAGENLKPAKSFMNLLKQAPLADFYAFADQDDYWKKEKMYEAVKKLEECKDKRAIYFSNVEIVDKNLNLISISKNRIVSLGTSFVSSPAIGCTMVINNKMRDIIIDKDITDIDIDMHDSWIYRIALAIEAKIIYDHRAFIKYRQHESNVVGIGNNKSILKSVKDIFDCRKKYKSSIANNILKFYDIDIVNNDNKELLNKLAKLSKYNTLKNRFSVVVDKRFRSNSKKNNLKFIYDVIVGRG